MPLFTPTKASAACSRGLTGSHTPILPISPIPPSLSPSTSTARLPPPHPPTNPVTPLNRILPRAPLWNRTPTPIKEPLFSPIRTPYSPSGSFPPTPSTPSLRRFVSPLHPQGRGHTQQVPRPGDGLSPLSAMMADFRARDPRRGGRERPPARSPSYRCDACDRVRKLLPAVWCGHQVTPSRMKNGMRVVRVTRHESGKFPRLPGLSKPRKSKRTGEANAGPAAAAPPPANEGVSDRRVVSSPAVETEPPQRVVASPTIKPRPTPRATTPPVVHTPFRNPDLNDQPLHWSPRMFEPEIDSHNWTWSDWDSPSREFEDVTYQTENWPIHDPLARLPPDLRKRVQAIMAMKPQDAPSATHSTDSVTADTVRYEQMGSESSFSSSSDSSWVLLNDVPWPPRMLQMLLNAEEQDRRLAAIGFFDRERANSTTHSVSKSDVSDHSKREGYTSLLQLYIDADNDRQRFAEEKGKENRPSSSEDLPAPSGPSASRPDVSLHSQSTQLSSWVDLDVSIWSDDRFGMYTRLEEITRAGGEASSSSVGTSSICSASSTRSASPEFSTWVDVAERKWSDQVFNVMDGIEERKRTARIEALKAAGVCTSHPAACPDASNYSSSAEFSSYVDVDEKKWSDQTSMLFNMMEEGRRERAMADACRAAGVSSMFEDETDTSDLPRSPEFSPWVKVNVDKWSDDTLEIYTEIEEARRRGPEEFSTTLSASSSDASLPLSTDVHFAAQQHFHSLQGSPSPLIEAPSVPAAYQPVQVYYTAPVQQFPPSRSTRSSRHFHTLRQLPSAPAVEPQRSSEEPPQSSGFGWKSIACVAAAAAAVGAGLAYWFSG
ncbi:hypothetical protein F5Y05DRAFT_70583 [Hypoxylon sp. FL0543]|nr:hypothetical protein F5Y05DRAFT_70583 [Hypoxylon sp. FL0543]